MLSVIATTLITPLLQRTNGEKPASWSTDTILLLTRRVVHRRLAEPRGAHLGHPLLRLEVHVHQPEAIAVSVVPLEVVHRAPLEVALDRHAVGRRPLELRQAGAEVHDAVGVVNLAIVGE